MEDVMHIQKSELINLREFVLNYQKLFTKYKNCLPVSACDVAKAVSLPYFGSEECNETDEQQRYSLAKENCSLDLLKSSDDNRVSKYIPGFTELVRKVQTQYPMEAMKLRTLQNILKSKSVSHQNPFKRTTDTFTMVKLPQSYREGIEEHDETFYSSNDLGKMLKIYIRVYRRPRVSHVHHELEKPVFAQEIICLGTNYLSELRDKIECICKNKHYFDISENPKAPLPDKVTDPGYIFITDTFYNDTRNPQNSDYSECIREWSKTAYGYENIVFKSAIMEQAQFIDLDIRLGSPQHYLHHGNCEHVFIFSQIEIITDPKTGLLSSNDPEHNVYPLQTSYNSFNNKSCNTCGLLDYMYVVVGSNRQLHDPAYLCSKCFLSYHYVDGKKIGNFKAYRLKDSYDTIETNDGVTAQKSTETETEIDNESEGEESATTIKSTSSSSVCKETKNESFENENIEELMLKCENDSDGEN